MARTRTATVWLVGLWLLALPGQGFGAAWTLAPQKYDFELFSQYFWNDTDFNASGRRVRKPNDGRFEEFRGEVKVEAGLPLPSSTLPPFLHRLNVLFSLPVEIAHYEDRNVDLQTIGVEEIRLGVKYCLTCKTASEAAQRPNDVTSSGPILAGPLAVSGQLTGKFPACNKRAQPPLADCQLDGEVRLLVSQGFFLEPRRYRSAPPGSPAGVTKLEAPRRARLYVNLEVGYRFRAEEPADEIPYVVEIGGYPWSSERARLLLKGVLDGVESRPFGGRGAEEDFIKWTLSGRLELGRLLVSRDPTSPRQTYGDPNPTSSRQTYGVEIGGGTVFAGKNTGAGQSVFVKLFYNY